MSVTNPLTHLTSSVIAPGSHSTVPNQLTAAHLPGFSHALKSRLHYSGPRLRVSERRLGLFVIDILFVNAALLIATTLFADFVPTVENILVYNKWFLTLTAVWVFSAVFFDCYNLARSANVSAILRNIILAAFVTMLVYIFIPVLTPPLQSRGLLFWLVLFTTGSLTVWRVAYATVFVQPWFQQRALVMGAGQAGRALATALMSASTSTPNPYRGTGYRLVGFIDDDASLLGSKIEGIKVVGDHHTIVELAKTLKVDEVIVAITDRDAISDELFDSLLRCRELGLRVVTMATVYERLTGRVPIDHAGRDLQMVMPMDDNAGERAYQLFKRAIDIVSALVGVLLMGLFCTPLAIINARTSPGLLFYKQRRIGQGGKIIEVYKFRSMRPDAEKGTGAVWAQKNDNRITPIGKFLRKTRLDEMPQFLNILKGEMSLIGPRPERPEFVNALALMLPYYRARHAVKPGLTGWAQIKYGYGDTHEASHMKLEYDLYYVKHASPWLDLSIMLQTLPVMLLGKGQ